MKWLPPVIQGVGSIASSAMNVFQAGKNRKFQERMSSTAHQREMADLKKAGLNPLLTGKYGGSSTPSGSVGQTTNPAEGLSNYASAQAGLKQQKPLVAAQINQINSAADLNLANKEKVSAEAALIASQTAGTQATTDRTTKLLPIEIKKMEQEITNLGQTAKLAGKQGQKITQEIKNLKEEFTIIARKAAIAEVATMGIPEKKAIEKALTDLEFLIFEYNTPTQNAKNIKRQLKADYRLFKAAWNKFLKNPKSNTKKILKGTF